MVPTSNPAPDPRTHQILLNAVRQAHVSLRGRPFPPLGGVETKNRSNRISAEDTGSEGERWEFFRRLLFGDVRPYFEDIGFYGGTENPRGSILSIVNTAQSAGEFLLFAKRLWAASGYEGEIELQVKLTGCKGRKLVTGSSGRFMSGTFICDEPQILVSRSLHTTDLAAGWQEHAADLAQDILALFNMSNPPRDMLLADISALLEHRPV
jgi:hypothetical protein